MINKAHASSYKTNAFTIVELLIVIVVIAILAAISIVAYRGIQDRATRAVLQSDLRNAATQLGIDKATSGMYPTPDLPSNVAASANIDLQYTSDGNTYCLTATSGYPSSSVYNISSSGSIAEGACSGHSATGIAASVENGAFIQAVNNANCPAVRTRVVDARDNRTYWVQKMADGKCWMLTNLAYAGGGSNTYGDVKPLTNGAGSPVSYTVASYYIPSGSNATSEPTAPSVSTGGSGQYGYLYNWCAAMGGQLTGACANASTPAPDPGISICASGWRLPTGNGGEIAALNTAVNGGSTNSDAGLLNDWLAHRSGLWSGTFSYQGSYAYYWTSTQHSGSNGYRFLVNVTNVNTGTTIAKDRALAVRCIAS